MAKIVYLFGAGASANVLPVVKDTPKRILKMIERLPELNSSGPGLKNCTDEEVQKLTNELQWLYDNSEKHATIDTWAKKLSLKCNYSDYFRLIAIYAAYFALEQLYGEVDSRYDTFWASIMQNTYKNLPPNISILSWNYDSQFELSYLDYSGCSYDDLCLLLGLNLGDKQSANRVNNFNIMKLNGTAWKPKLGNTRNDGDSNYNGVRLKMVYDNYIGTMNSGVRNVNFLFAWDELDRKPENSLNSETEIKLRVNEAEILVVIGYSFPYFNRAIDRKIIESMPNLKKIYFQDMDPRKIANAFKAISDNESVKKELIEYVDQFFLPPEL
jgi:hypothetical protein